MHWNLVLLVLVTMAQADLPTFHTTEDLIAQHGYPLEEHRVTTDDGYSLGMHRIPNGRQREDPWGGQRSAILVQHGVLASSLDWILTGPGNALGYKLADSGFDLWLGNLRGTIYSQDHFNLTINEPEYWDYSWHELGVYDLAAMIDYIISVTGQAGITYIGHSMGATIAAVLLSQRPEYNSKLKLLILLAPVVKLEHNTSVLRFSAPFWKSLQKITGFSGLYGFPPAPDKLQHQLEPVCREPYFGQGFCAKVLHTLAGYSGNLNQTLLPILFGHYPTQTSMKTLSHFLQGMQTGNFSMYDYGLDENLKRYNQMTPPEYPLSRITTPAAIFYGDSDPFTHFKDLSWLGSELPNVVGTYRVPSKAFSHLSFLWASDVAQVLYDPLIRLVKQFEYIR